MVRIFKDKNVIMWGVGAFQVDIEAIYHIDNVVAYIDDDVEERNYVTVEKEQIISSKNIQDIVIDNPVFVLCGRDTDYAVRLLKNLGYNRSNYILADELLANKDIYDIFYSSEITIYGAGKTYLYWKKEIEASNVNIGQFAVTKKEFDNFDGKPVIDIEELKKLRGKTKIVVSSIYYKEIYRTLKSAGFEPGCDFVQLDTFLALGNLTQNINSKYDFVNRSKGLSNLLVILSGYKEFVWESVFGRLEAYVPENTDVCIVTSGKDDKIMREFAEKNNWSYLSTEVNNVSLVTNMAITLHPYAEYITKMDEDIFVTKGTFEELISTYNRMEKESEYEVGFVTPLIPVNGYGYARILDILGIKHKWEEKFGEIKITDCYNHHKTIHDNPEAAEFLWGKDNEDMADIDMVQSKLQSSDFAYSICPVRYSIGLIMFSRESWLKMGMFPVNSYENMGADEKKICKYCMMEGKAMVVSENCIVGHLSYGPQHKVMEEFYRNNKERFMIH